MDDRGNQRHDKQGGLGLGGPQRGEIGGDEVSERPDDGQGEGQQRNPGGSSRDSENLE